MLEYGVTSFERSAVSVINGSALESLMGSQASSCEHFQHLEQILDLIPQHLFFLEPDATLSFANRAVREYVGHMDLVSLSDRLARIIHPDDIDALLSVYEEAMSRGISIEAEARVLSKGGQYRWFLHRLLPLRDKKGHIVRWCGARIDIEDQKQGVDAQNENLALRDEIEQTHIFEEIVGTSPVLRETLARVARVAPTDSTVLITGETGTGKELIARAIHKHSKRSGKPFISVNCAAIPKDLIASELFGHEKGAFTGALQRRIGRFEQAEGGTIFLDEIGELPAETQVALLRVLQEREFERLGGVQTIRANVRVIAATHRDLGAAIENGAFRSDLFYRINVFPVEVPSLQERKEDIQLLAEYFIDRYASKAGKKIKWIRRSSLEKLKAYSWPGNIRELQNVIERSVILCDRDEFSIDESWLLEQPSGQRRLTDEMEAQEKEQIEAALARRRGRISGPSGAARELGMPASTLDSKIKSLKIDKRRFQLLEA
jgi:formate hydrogenlyase transcriptional activator